MEGQDYRKELLLNMYNQLWNSINNHITVLWQSIGTLIGAFAIFALTEKKVISLDYASSLIVLICGWLLANLLDTSYWYNRNLAITANIEKEFLGKEDLRKIHYYFGKHRKDNKMMTLLRIQFALGIGICLTILCLHFFTEVKPGFSFDLRRFDFIKALPYLALVAVIVYLYFLRRHRSRSYDEFLENSPGIDMDTKDIRYGRGHGFPDSND